ncbi:MAG: trypsin-like peptidase domain-containing protein, partial [Pseudomonadales bacterium]|nr:trypsin-like peptidase domain-containing protein [Pseudomonadales bacterium]
GFVVADGRLVATNFHVVDQELDRARKEHLVVFIGSGQQVEYRTCEIAAQDEHHDLALLRYGGTPLPRLELGDSSAVREGSSIAFTGFPIGAILGLHPVTHQGIVSALTPIAIPARDSRELTTTRIAALREPFEVIQLDATAYPGNSGSPVYLQDTGAVVGVINQVFVKGRKENVLRDPSAITYAIPARYLRDLIERL